MNEIRAETVIAHVDALDGAACRGCATRIHALEAAVGVFLGSKDAARCLPCLARLLGRDADDLVRSAAAQIERLDCYRAGWNHARARMMAAGALPPARFPADLAAGDAGAPSTAAAVASPAVAAEWDAGATSCGDLVLELRLRLRGVPPGALLLVRATDPGAPGDLPAWCRVTGHEMVRAAHPEYLIRRRSDPFPAA